MPALTAALRHAVELQRAAAPDDREPMAYALRVDAAAPWQRVLQAVYGAGQAGLAVPFFVLRSAAGTEVMLVLPLPRITSAPDAETVRAIEQLLGGSEDDRAVGAPDSDAVPAVDARAAAPVLAVRIAADGATTLRLGERALDRDCAPAAPLPSSDLPAPIAARDLAGGETAPDAVALGRCLEAGDVRMSSATLDADPSLPFSSVAPVLEALRARTDVAIAISSRARGASR